MIWMIILKLYTYKKIVLVFLFHEWHFLHNSTRVKQLTNVRKLMSNNNNSKKREENIENEAMKWNQEFLAHNEHISR